MCVCIILITLRYVTLQPYCPQYITLWIDVTNLMRSYSNGGF